MIEPIMYFGIGFLVAALLGLLFVPLVHNRAVRLTMRRLEAATPLSIAEIRADKDQLRAEFAMSTRRLEMSVEQMKAKTTASSPSSARRPTLSISSRKNSARRPRRLSRGIARKASTRSTARHRGGVSKQIGLAARSGARACRQGGGARQAHRRTRRAFDLGRQSARRARGAAHPDRGDEGQRRRLRARRARRRKNGLRASAAKPRQRPGS